MGDYMRGPIETQLGPMWMNSFPPLVKEDFYQQYHQPTFWPYCESLERCIVYRCVTLCRFLPYCYRTTQLPGGCRA